jgi:cytochrome c oxidase subunit 3
MTTTAHAAAGHAAAAHPLDEGMSRGMAGMVLFIASEIMLFGGLFAAYFYVRNQADAWPPEAVEHTASASFALILTVFLISSSVTAHIAMLGIKSGNRELFKFGIAVSIVLGSIFIGGQIYEWLSLFDEGLNATTTVYGSTLFVTTGFHGAHVIAGLAMLVVVFVRAIWGDFTPARHLFADAAVLYWHFVDFIWLFVLAILYISATGI